jgi:hypothetical protein
MAPSSPSGDERAGGSSSGPLLRGGSGQASGARAHAFLAPCHALGLNPAVPGFPGQVGEVPCGEVGVGARPTPPARGRPFLGPQPRAVVLGAPSDRLTGVMLLFGDRCQR